MTFGKIEINTQALETKLKIVHEHIGNMIEDLDSVCVECGSQKTDIEKFFSDSESKNKLKHCNSCGCEEIIE